MLFYRRASFILPIPRYSNPRWVEHGAAFSENLLTKCHRSSLFVQPSRCFASGHIEDTERGARPLYFQQSPIADHRCRKSSSASSVPLTPYDFLGTASALPPHARHLAPCLGAALATSPLAGNLMRLGQRQPHELSFLEEEHQNQNPIDQKWANLLSRTGFLANNLFFQLIRESPIHMVRNKSMPAVYLTPDIIGCFLGHHQQDHQMSKTITRNNEKDANAVLKTQLRRDFGIKSNHIHDTAWTGISLARWMDLVIPWERDITNNEMHEMSQQSLVSALWLIALWGTRPSKDSLCGYYESLKRAGIFLPSNQAPVDIPEPSKSFHPNDFCPKKVEASMNHLIEYYSSSDRQNDVSNGSSSSDDLDNARSFELVCATIVLQQQPQDGISSPIVPNGYFAYDDGGMKADCTEVVVREILTMLLWDESSGTLDTSRLASTASQKLIDVVKLGNDVIENTDVSQRQKGEQELGQVWFDLLSNLPCCDYLAVSPNGKAFELAPTSESIATALWHLLEGGNENDKRAVEKQPWTSLHEMANFWSETQPSYPLSVTHDRLKHQSSDGGSMEHELITLHFRNKAMEIRLRCDFEKVSGMAAVTHLMKPKQEQLISPGQVKMLQEICLNRQIFEPSLLMLCLALQSVHENILPSASEVDNDTDSLAVFESLLWLATPYGPDRRELKPPNCTDTSLDYDSMILKQSQNILRERILHAFCICETHRRSGGHLLSWILWESPVVIETSSPLSNHNDSSIEEAILSLPVSILDNDCLLEAIEWNWLCFGRGRLLASAIRWKLGKLSLWQLFSRSKIHEAIEVISLSRLMGERNRFDL